MAEADFSTIKDSLRYSVMSSPDGSKTLDLLGKKSIDLTEDECASLAGLLTASPRDLCQRSLSDFSGSVRSAGFYPVLFDKKDKF